MEIKHRSRDTAELNPSSIFAREMLEPCDNENLPNRPLMEELHRLKSCSHDRAGQFREDTTRPSGKPGGDDLEHMKYHQEVVVTTEQSRSMSGGHETSLGQTRGRRSRTYAISSGSCSHDRTDRCREDTRRPSGKPGGDDLEHMQNHHEVVVTTEQIDVGRTRDVPRANQGETI
ncbi:hypothetical protein J6590_084602 [Homalodisca vitripennis]|nr:hypothetical protein J6590_084602 [Homalodisca vitripennis]